MFSSPGSRLSRKRTTGGGGGGTPGGLSGQMQVNLSAAFAGAEFWRNSAGNFWIVNGVTATGFRAFKTSDSSTAPTNAEWGTFDWITAANVLTIGTTHSGTGVDRDVHFIAGTFGNFAFQGSGIVDCGSNIFTVNAGSTTGFRVNAGNVNIGSGGLYGSSSSAPNSAGPDTGMSRVVAGVFAFGNGTAADVSGWIQWGGQKRVTSDFSVSNSTALVNVTGLSVNLAAGRTYMFQTELYVTDAAAGGVQAAIAGTATATAIQYVGYTVADNAIKGKTNATALGTAVGSTVTTETAGIVVRITGTITVNAAGTLTVQMAQNTSNATATVAKQGSYFIVQDMP